MYLNTFAGGLTPLDLSTSDEIRSLLESARDLGIEVHHEVQCRSGNQVVNGLRLHYLEWGDPDAPPVLLLHGGNQSSHSWDLVSLVLSSRFHVLALDQRGHGDSEWPRDAEMSAPAMAGDVREFAAAMGLVRPVLMGHSMGGNVALTLLSADPEFASRAVIVDIGPEVAAEGRTLIQGFVSENREFESVETFVQNVVRYNPFRTEEHVRRTVRYNLLQRADGKYVSKHFRRVYVPASIPLTPTLDDVARLACPLLLVRGAESRILLADAAERFVSALPNGTLVTVPNCGHNVHSQNTPGFLEQVLPFLTSE